MTDKTHPDSGSTHIIRYALELGLLWIDGDGRDKVREALDALDILEAQLESIGAGGVSGPLMGKPQEMPDLTKLTERGAKAWAGVDAQGLRDGVASAGSEPVEFELPPTPFKTFAPGVEIGYDLFGGADIRLGGEFVYVHINYDYRYTHNSARMVLAEQIAGILSGSLVTHPSPPEGMAGGWMPMADAPRDGTLILAAIYIHSSDGTAEWQRHAIYFDEERDCTYLDGGDDAGGEFDDYEFWTPLPPPPTTPAGNEKGGVMADRVRNLQPGQRFRLKRTGELYEFLGHKRDTPGGTQYAVRRSGCAKPSTLHHSCHVEIIKDQP